MVGQLYVGLAGREAGRDYLFFRYGGLPVVSTVGGRDGWVVGWLVGWLESLAQDRMFTCCFTRSRLILAGLDGWLGGWLACGGAVGWVGGTLVAHW